MRVRILITYLRVKRIFKKEIIIERLKFSGDLFGTTRAIILTDNAVMHYVDRFVVCGYVNTTQ